MKIFLLGLCLVAGSCALSDPVTFSASYQTQDGAQIGGSFRIDPKYAKQK